MKNNDVLTLMKKLSKQEMRKLKSYMGKQFKKNSIPIRLFDFLRKYYPDFEHEKISYTQVHELLFPGTTFNKKMIQNTLYDLRKEIRNFLVFQHLENHPAEKNMILLRAYGHRQLEPNFEKQYKSTKRILAEAHQQDMWYFFNHVQLEHEKYFNIGTKRMIERGSIFQAMESLDQFYAAAKLRYASEIFNGYNLRNEDDPSIRFLEDIEKAGWCDNFIYHVVYKKVLSLVRERTTTAYIELKNYFHKNYQQLQYRDQFIVISYLLNHASVEVRRGNEDFNMESFELMKFGLSQDFFIVDGVLHPDHFMNIVTVASRVGDFDWANKFVENYSGSLSSENKDYYKKYYKSLIYFYQKDYENVSKTLQDITLKEPQDQYRGRWLKIIADYETYGNTHELDKQCEAFYQFVRRNKLISEEKKAAMLLAYKGFNLLMNPNTTKAKLEKLLEHSYHFYYKSWMDEKIKLLKE